MNLITSAALIVALAAGGAAGLMKAGNVLIERIQRQNDAGLAMVELAKRDAAPVAFEAQAARDAQLRAASDAELVQLIELARR